MKRYCSVLLALSLVLVPVLAQAAQFAILGPRDQAVHPNRIVARLQIRQEASRFPRRSEHQVRP